MNCVICGNPILENDPAFSKTEQSHPRALGEIHRRCYEALVQADSSLHGSADSKSTLRDKAWEKYYSAVHKAILEAQDTAVKELRAELRKINEENS